MNNWIGWGRACAQTCAVVAMGQRAWICRAWVHQRPFDRGRAGLAKASVGGFAMRRE
jgi:hypothetical protein